MIDSINDKKNEYVLFTLPHAGGSSRSFAGWEDSIYCRVVNIDYPGHWTLMREPLISSFDGLIDYIIDKIMSETDTNNKIMLFGHSMGAIISWYISDYIIEHNRIVDTLFLSASHNPGDFPEEHIKKIKTDEDITKLVDYDYSEHLDSINRQFDRIFLPLIKNDLLVCRDFKLNKKNNINVNSIVLYGKDDALIDKYEVKKWKEYTNCIDFVELEGKHLFIEKPENKKSICELINRRIKK